MSQLYNLLKKRTVAVSLDANKDFKAYKSGVFATPSNAPCSSTINNALLLYGYGNDQYF